jgi:hypothetical protein
LIVGALIALVVTVIVAWLSPLALEVTATPSVQDVPAGIVVAPVVSHGV